jgi:hypothetical protein
MDVRRQYSLPNCTLVLEGFSDNHKQIEPVDGRAVLSTLTNATCYFTGIETPLQGKRTFLENLVTVVSAYAQECLSGVHHPLHLSDDENRIVLERINPSLHLLRWYPPENVSPDPVELELTTVQFFDLVEAVDQLFTDTQTLPDLFLKLQPVSRRYRQSDQPFVQRLIPLTLGMTGLTLAAIACFFLPIPEMRKPEPATTGNPTQTIPPSAGNPPSGTSSPTSQP